MATNSQPQETPECDIFRKHCSRLVNAISNPLRLATELFSRGIIDSTMLQQMSTLGFTPIHNTTTLLTAVFMKIRTDPSVFEVFLSALTEDPSMQPLVESMRGKCFICRDIITCNVPPLPS